MLAVSWASRYLDLLSLAVPNDPRTLGIRKIECAEPVWVAHDSCDRCAGRCVPTGRALDKGIMRRETVIALRWLAIKAALIIWGLLGIKSF